MTRLRKFLGLTSDERRLLVSAALLLGAIRLGLGLFSFQTFRRLLARLTRASAGLRHADSPSPDRIAWAVTVASRYTPGARTCFVKALAAQVLLTRRGYPTHLRIGVIRGEEGQLQAHAWVESQGRIVIGGTESPSRYTPLPHLEGERP